MIDDYTIVLLLDMFEVFKKDCNILYSIGLRLILQRLDILKFFVYINKFLIHSWFKSNNHSKFVIPKKRKILFIYWKKINQVTEDISYKLELHTWNLEVSLNVLVFAD